MTSIVAECGDCRLGYQTPRPALEASIAYMNMRWRSHDSYVADRAEQKARAQPQLAKLSRLVCPGSRVLDFGAGTGMFVREALDHGWEAIGVERSEIAVERAWRENSVQLHLDLNDVKNAEFDAVTLWDVVEHLRDPIGVIRTLAGFLRSGGWMLFETGNWESWSRLAAGDSWALYLFDHQYYFSPESLRRTIERAGLVNAQLLAAAQITPPPDPPVEADLAELARWRAYQRAMELWPDHAATDIMVLAAQKP